MGGSRDPGGLGDWLLPPAAVLEGLPDAVVAAGRDGRILFANALAEELFGYARSELLGQPVQMLWPERVREQYRRSMEQYVSTENPLRFETAVRGLRRDGSEFIGEMSWGIVETTAGPVLLAVGRDVSERRAGESRLRAVAALGERALAGGDPADLAGETIELARTLLAVQAAEVRLADGSLLAGFESAQPAAAPQSGNEHNIRLAVGDGDELLVVPGRQLSEEELSFLRAVAHTLASALARQRTERRMRHEALHDPLTGLANRTLLRDRLEHAIARSERERGATAVLFIDLDNFKAVNDSYGHAAGDAVLVESARRLHAAVRPGDTVARIGGDEFIALCEHVNADSALAVARRLQEALRPSFTAGGVEHQLSASIGVALGDGEPDRLLGDADAASYRAKAAGRGRVELFE
ncbi:MAG: diguanylate cyclase domain-containing protein [Solirubrobacteraceae bacterium]